MKKALLIAEKPSLMQAIREAYIKNKGNVPYNIDFIAQAGHLLRLKSPKEIDKNKYKWNLNNLPFTFPYQLVPSDRKAFATLKEIKAKINSNKYDLIIHAGDPDQEGELLVRETLGYINNTLPVKRFWSNDITESAVIEELNHMKDDKEYDGFYYAALTRQRADYDFGMNLTTVATLKYGEYKNIMNVGRVKSAIISLIGKREQEIADFVPTTDYRKAFSYKNIEFICDKPFATKEEIGNRFPDKATIIEATIKDKKVKAPKFFKLSTLQAEAARAFGFNGARTLQIAQSLYEKKLISYPRTDCDYIFSSTNVRSIIPATIRNIRLDNSLIKRNIANVMSDKDYVNDKAAALEGHTAIIPTGKIKNMSSDEFKVYNLIARRFLAAFGAYKEVHMVNAKAVEGDYKPNENQDIYVSSVSKTIKRGYEKILRPDEEKDKTKIIDFKEGDTLKPVEFEIKEHTTRAPERFNDASLILALDDPSKFIENNEDAQIKYKIGTPATRANIIYELIKGDFLTQEKGSRNYYATEKSMHLLKNMGDTSIFNIKTSGTWENMLEGIRNGEMSYKKVQSTLHNECEDVTKDIIKRDTDKFKKTFTPQVNNDANIKTNNKSKGKYPEKKRGTGDPNSIVYINIPYALKETAKKQGAIWDGDKKSWCFKGFTDEEIKKSVRILARIGKTKMDKILPKEERDEEIER